MAGSACKSSNSNEHMHMSLTSMALIQIDHESFKSESGFSLCPHSGSMHMAPWAPYVWILVKQVG